MSKKSFWKRPEGVTGAIFLLAALAGAGYGLLRFGAAMLEALQDPLTLGISITTFAAVAYALIDPKLRGRLRLLYVTAMRAVTSWFVRIDPISTLKSYLNDLRKNLRNLGKQIGALRGQMRQLGGTIADNALQIEQSTQLAQRARNDGKQAQLALELRKIGRLKDSNQKLQVLYDRMEILLRVLKKMYDNSEILLEDIKDQVSIKERELLAINASQSAIRSAMSIIAGDKNQRFLFDEAMEALAEDVGSKVGEIERFMSVSANFMTTIDLQQGVFEESGLKMLEDWERKSDEILLGKDAKRLLEKSKTVLDLNQKPPVKTAVKTPEAKPNEENRYHDFF